MSVRTLSAVRTDILRAVSAWYPNLYRRHVRMHFTRRDDNKTRINNLIVAASLVMTISFWWRRSSRTYVLHLYLKARLLRAFARRFVTSSMSFCADRCARQQHVRNQYSRRARWLQLAWETHVRGDAAALLKWETIKGSEIYQTNFQTARELRRVTCFKNKRSGVTRRRRRAKNSSCRGALTATAWA